MKFMKVLIFIAIIAFTVCFDEKCGTTPQNCGAGRTCCRMRGPTGQAEWRCFPGTNATCCSDGKNVCPPRTKCDLVKFKCDPLSFLTEVENFVQEEITPEVETLVDNELVKLS